jgi:hypothetical protein
VSFFACSSSSTSSLMYPSAFSLHCLLR